MLKNKVITGLLAGLLVLSQTNLVHATSFDGSLNPDDWTYDDFKDESNLSPEYIPSDHEMYGGYGPNRNNQNTGNVEGGKGIPGFDGNGKITDGVVTTVKFQVRNNVCYATITENRNGKVTVKPEIKVALEACINNGATTGSTAPDKDKQGSVGHIDDSAIEYIPTEGDGENVQDIEDKLHGSDAEKAALPPSFEIVYDDNGKIKHVIDKNTGKQYKVGEKIMINDKIFIGIVGPSGELISANNPNQTVKTDLDIKTDIENDLTNLAKETHILYYTTDKTKGNSSLVKTDIFVNEDSTVSYEDFKKSMNLLVKDSKGKMIEDKDRVLFYLEGKLIASVKSSDTIHIDMYESLLKTFKSGIYVKTVDFKN